MRVLVSRRLPMRPQPASRRAQWGTQAGILSIASLR